MSVGAVSVNGVLSVLLLVGGSGGLLRNRADSSTIVLALHHGRSGSRVVFVPPALDRTRAPQTRILCTRDDSATAPSCFPTAGSGDYQ